MADNSENAFLAALGQLVVDWNFAEGWLKTLLIHLAGSSQMATILTVELGAIGLQNALTAAAAHVLEPEPADRLVYAVKLYEVLRGYRNYWVHGTIFSAGDEDGEPHGFTYVPSAKGKLQTHSQVVEIANVKQISAACWGLGTFVGQLHRHLQKTPDKSGVVPPLPDKQPLPPEVDKNAPYPQWQKPSPKSSRKKSQ